MADDTEMRFRLQQVAAYRELCRQIRVSGRGNIFFALLMLFLAYSNWKLGQADWMLILYAALALAELGAGLLKWAFPSAEGVLIDALILLLFAVFNLGIAGLQVQQGRNPSLIAVFLSLFLLSGAVSRFRSYSGLRRLFAERPSRDQIAWFDELVYEIRTADPETDDQALDLPTKPHWKAKLLGSTAFFVARRGDAVVVAGPFDFDLTPDGRDRRTGLTRVLLHIHGQTYPEFGIDDASWDNYRKWLAANHGTRPA